MHHFLFAVTLIASASSLNAAELRFVGVLANSGASGSTRVEFEGDTTAGMGPVLDDSMTIWERGGSKQLNRYALDGRLVGRFKIPESTDRSDRMTLAGDRLVMHIRDTVYTLPVDAEPGAEPTRLLDKVDALSTGSEAGRVAIYRRNEGVAWLNATTGAIEPIASPDIDVSDLQVADGGTVYAYSRGSVLAWKNGEPVAGFPKSLNGERPQKVGRYWYTHAWHGTINRFNDRFEPDPGVVLGGASGSFIGYLPLSVDVTNGRGMLHVRDNVFAVSGMNGIVQLLVWNDAEQRFELARRLGALTDIAGLAIDQDGRIWTPYGSLRWNDRPDTPFTLGDKEPDAMAQPVVIDGRVLSLIKKHYSYVQLASGPIVDESGWSHYDTKGLDGFDLSKSVTGAALVPDASQYKIVFVDQEGHAFELAVSDRGGPRGKPEPVTIPGLVRCTSLAWFGERLLAADAEGIKVFEAVGKDRWEQRSVLSEVGGQFIHSDGQRLAISDPAGGSLTLMESLSSKLATYDGLATPTHIAIAGDRIVVYESGKQRLVKLELEGSPGSKSDAPQPASSEPKVVADNPHTESEFQDLSRPGGLPLAVAVTQEADGLIVSVRTTASAQAGVTLGVANREQAVTVSADVDPQREVVSWRFPKADWSGLRLAIAVETPHERERFGFADGLAIHAPFSKDSNDWADFDLDRYVELVDARKQTIRIGFEQPVDGKATIVIEDTEGRRVRNLVAARSFGAGEHVVVWDGLDESGKLVPPGRYRWRGITHAGIEPVYRMHFANGGEPTTAPWGPNHSTFQDATSNGRLVFFAAPVTEGGYALVALDADGRMVQGYDHLHGYGIMHDAIAADDRYLYCAQDGFAWGGTKGIDQSSDDWKAEWKLTIVRYDIETGRLAEFPDKQRAIEVNAMEVGPGSDHPDLGDFNLGGLAVHDGKLYVGSRNERAVIVLDADTGKRVALIPLEGVRHLATDRERGLVYAATGTSVVRLSDRKRVVESGALSITGLAIAPDGDIVVSDHATHQIHRFSADGKPRKVIGVAGGPYKGAYDRQRMVNPTGLAFGPDGKLWVTENRWNPKRLLAWDSEGQKVVYEKFGMPHYGGDGSGFDPENPRRWIGLGCFWDVDIDSGTAYPTHVLSLTEGHFGNYHPQSYRFFREAGRTFVCTRGKIAVISEVLPDGTLHDLAAIAGTHHFGYGCDWDPPQAYIDAFYAKWPEKRAGERPGRKGEGKPWSQRGMGVLWVDRNGDGQAQQNEFEFCGDKIQFGGGAWGHLQTSLTLTVPIEIEDQVKVVQLKPRGFAPNGVPDYPPLEEAVAKAVPIDLSPGYKRSGVATVADRFGRLLFNSDPEMNAYQLAESPATHAWSYPNQWSDVHGSHNAPLPEPGVMQGTLAYLGVASFDDQSDVVFLNGNHGRCFVLTTDGLYLDEAFVDVRVSYLKNEYRLGGEIFGGSFGRAETDGRYYVQIGHGPYRIYELTGFDSAKRIAGEIEVTREQIAAAERETMRAVAEKQSIREAAAPTTIRWDRSGRYKAEVDVRVDATHLHLTYRIEDSSPWVNHGRDWTKLFATGDTVDLQFASDPSADRRRRGPVPGDKRLLIAPMDGKPIAVLYEHRKPGGANPIVFNSPWRAEKVDHVQRLDGATIDVKTDRNGYVVTASIPLESIGFKPEPGRAYLMDFGATYGDAEGTDTNLRSYWSNTSTGLVDDIPGEIMLSPTLWGEVTFDRPKP